MADLVDPMDAHAPLNPAIQGGVLVEREIVAGLVSQQDQDLLEAALGFIRPGQIRTWR